MRFGHWTGGHVNVSEVSTQRATVGFVYCEGGGREGMREGVRERGREGRREGGREEERSGQGTRKRG